MQGWSDDQSSEELRHAKLHGLPSPLPEKKQDGLKWEDMKAWEDELEKMEIKRPRTIKGIEKVVDVDAVLSAIMPWRITNSDVVRRQPKEKLMKWREESEEQLAKLLSHLGF